MTTASVLAGCAAFAACSDDAAAPPRLVEGQDARPFDPPPIDATRSDAAVPDAAPDTRPLHDAADSALEAMMLAFWSGDRS